MHTDGVFFCDRSSPPCHRVATSKAATASETGLAETALGPRVSADMQLACTPFAANAGVGLAAWSEHAARPGGRRPAVTHRRRVFEQQLP